MHNTFQQLVTLVNQPHWLSAIAALSLLMFIGSLLLLPWLIRKLPEDYFLGKQRQESQLHQRHPIVYLLIMISKNVLGVLLLAMGILMLVLPGQGLLTILLGLSLINFPGKYRLEKNLIRRPSVHKFLNWIRKRGEKSALLIP